MAVEDGRSARADAALALTPLTPISAATTGHRFFGLVRGELALLLRGRAWWWYLGAAGLGVACLTAPMTAVHPHLVALGEWSGTPKVFEGLFTALWYLGVLNSLPALDFLGGGAAAREAGVPMLYALATVPLLAAAIAGRRKRGLRR